MASKIFRSAMVVAVAVLLSVLTVVVAVLYDHFTEIQTQQLKDELSLAVTATEQYGNAFLENVEADRFRITWVDADGTVLFDTQADQTIMENHADREEIQEALQTGSGSCVRTSSTLTKRTFYEAQRLQDGTVLRVSANQETAWFLLVGMLSPLGIIVLLAMALAAILSHRMARRIVEPINELDLEQPLKNDIYAELSPLLHRINRQNNQITAQMEALRRNTDEFEQIIKNMQEGLVLLNQEGTILSINPAAERLFEAGCIGKSFLQLERSNALREALNDALDKGSGAARLERNGRRYQVDLSRIRSDGGVIGAVALAFDITEQLSAEQVRREFSANVSHELKTPLQGIIGSAELLENGLVKEEDLPRFVGHIRKEAARLVALIEDIIRLSQLDEGVDMPTEPVDMLALAQEAAAVVRDAAAEKNVELRISGEGFTVVGVRRLLFEMIYNLCDNGVKYNVPGGTVRIRVQDRVLTVSDTGIGIPWEHQPRIFERFYRVDKSHSKQSGGTGLGLSIVKHAAAFHKAQLQLESVPDKGTSIAVIF